MKKSTLMLILCAAAAFFGYRYLSKKNAAPSTAAPAATPEQSTPGDDWFSGGAPGGTDTGTAGSYDSQVQPVTQVVPATQPAQTNPIAPATDDVKGPVIPALVGYKGISRPISVNYTGTGINPRIYTLNSGNTVGGYLNNSGSYTIVTIVQNPYYVAGTVSVPVSDLNIPAQV
jgi:hypothetical protein